MARFWLGQKEWTTKAQSLARGLAPIDCWRDPVGVLDSIDLRSPAHCGISVTPNGVCLFVTANATNLGAGFDNLGTDIDRVLTGPEKTGWKSRFGLPANLAAIDLKGALWETMTVQADPTTQDRCMPLMPKRGAGYELLLGGLRFTKPFGGFGDSEGLPVIDLHKRQYRALRQMCLAGTIPIKVYKKWVLALSRRYGVDYRQFIPGDLPDEGTEEPTTTLLDDFNRADADALGTASGGFTWTETLNDTDIVSTAAECQSNLLNCRNRAEQDLGSADMYSQITAVNANSWSTNAYGGPTSRVASGAVTSYWWLIYSATGQHYKTIAGVDTALGTPATITLGANDVYKQQVTGTTLDGFQNGSNVKSITDSAIDGVTVGGLRTGFAGAPFGLNPRFRAFEASDGLTGGVVGPLVGGRLVSQGMLIGGRLVR